VVLLDRHILAGRIKVERNNRNLSQRQLAELTGINNTVLSRIESAEKDVSLDSLIAIAKALDVDVGYLLFDSVSENADALTKSILSQVSKLGADRKKLFTDIMITLLENNKIWTDDSGLREPLQEVDYSEIGRHIHSERLKQCMTQAKLSEDVGVTDNFISAIENGRETMSLDTLFRIAHALSVPVARLLTHADTGEPNNALCDAVEGLSHVGDRQSQILLNLITVLVDNSEKW